LKAWRHLRRNNSSPVKAQPGFVDPYDRSNINIMAKEAHERGLKKWGKLDEIMADSQKKMQQGAHLDPLDKWRKESPEKTGIFQTNKPAIRRADEDMKWRSILRHRVFRDMDQMSHDIDGTVQNLMLCYVINATCQCQMDTRITKLMPPTDIIMHF